MTETTRTFERRAYRAAGPAFLVTLGAVILAVIGVTALVAGIPAPLGVSFAAVGLLALLVGLAWGAADSRTEAAAKRRA